MKSPIIVPEIYISQEDSHFFPPTHPSAQRPQPFPYVPLIFIAVKAQVPKVQVFGVCALGSYLAALGGYGVGAARNGLGENWI